MSNRIPMYLDPPTTFTFASHCPEDDIDNEHDHDLRNRTSHQQRSQHAASAHATSPCHAPLLSATDKHRRASLATSPPRQRGNSNVAPPSPPLARAKTTSVVEQNENDLPFEEIAAMLTARGANNSSVGDQVRPRLKVSQSGRFEDQFYHAHEGSRAMGKLKNRTYLKSTPSDKQDAAASKAKSKNVNGKDVEQFSDADIVYAGYLVKQGSFWKTWRRRYFILRRDVPLLAYYDSQDELTKLGEIVVDATTTVKPTPRDGFPFQFVVEHAGRKLTLVAELGKPSTDAWIMHIQATVARRQQEAAAAASLRQSIGLRASGASGNGSFMDDIASLRQSSTSMATAPMSTPLMRETSASRDSPHGGNGGATMMKRFQTDAVAIASAMQESIAVREEERLREQRLRQSRATNNDDLPPTWQAAAAATSQRHDSIATGSQRQAPRRFRSFSAGSVLSTRSIDYEPMRPRDDSGLAPSTQSRASHDAAAAAYPPNEHPATRAPCLSLPAFKPGPTLELAVSVGSKGTQEIAHMVVVMSTVAPGAAPRELSRTEMQSALSLRACGGDLFARDFNAALSVPLRTKDVLHFEVFACTHPNSEVMTQQLSLAFVRIAPVDIVLSRDATIVLECHRTRHANQQLLFLMLDRIVPSETLALGHTFPYAKRHFVADIVPLDKTKAADVDSDKATGAPEKMHSTGTITSVPGANGATALSSLGVSYNGMIRGASSSDVNAADATQVFITEELSSSYCSITVARAYLQFAQRRNRARIADAQRQMNGLEQMYGSAAFANSNNNNNNGSPTGYEPAPARALERFQALEAIVTTYARLRDVYKPCEDYCGTLETMLVNGKEPGVTGSLKRSTQKKDLLTEFMPTNLNVHVTRAKRLAPSSAAGVTTRNSITTALQARDSAISSKPPSDELVHSVITHGCMAAHVLGFKDGGLRRLRQTAAKALSQAQAPSESDRKLLDKIEQREDVVRSQVLAVASAAFLTVVALATTTSATTARSATIASDKKRSTTQQQHMDRLELICSTGFLLSIESLLSTLRSEKGMLEDMVDGVQWLNQSVSLRVVDADVDCVNNEQTKRPFATCIDVSPGDLHTGSLPGAEHQNQHQPLVATFALPHTHFQLLPALLQRGDVIKVHAVLFTQGINEMQSVANTMTDTRLQNEINAESCVVLQRYVGVYAAFVKYNARHRIGNQKATNASQPIEREDPRVAALPHIATQLAILVETLSGNHHHALPPTTHATHHHATGSTTTKHVQKKNVNILLQTSALCRAVGAGRTTCCKSGKDRTAMAVTLESSQVLVDHFHVKQGVQLCTAMRARGVRRVNVLANTGKDKFAFNTLQLKYLPECYKPPIAAADAHVAS